MKHRKMLRLRGAERASYVTIPIDESKNYEQYFEILIRSFSLLAYLGLYFLLCDLKVVYIEQVTILCRHEYY